MSAAKDIADCIAKLDAIVENFADDGDWYGCVRNARDSLVEAMFSEPAGFEETTEFISSLVNRFRN